MPEIYMMFVQKIFSRIFWCGGGRMLLPVISYAYEFCVPPPLGLYFLCRLRFAQGHLNSEDNPGNAKCVTEIFGREGGAK